MTQQVSVPDPIAGSVTDIAGVVSDLVTNNFTLAQDNVRLVNDKQLLQQQLSAAQAKIAALLKESGLPIVGAAVDYRNPANLAQGGAAYTNQNWSALVSLLHGLVPMFQRQYNQNFVPWASRPNVVPGVRYLSSYKQGDFAGMAAGKYTVPTQAAVAGAPDNTILSWETEPDNRSKNYDPVAWGKAWNRFYDDVKAVNKTFIVMPTFLTWVPDIATPGVDKFMIAFSQNKCDAVALDLYPRGTEPIEKCITACLKIIDGYFAGDEPRLWAPEWGRDRGISGRGDLITADWNFMKSMKRWDGVAWYNADLGAGNFAFGSDSASLQAFLLLLNEALELAA